METEKEEEAEEGGLPLAGGLRPRQPQTELQACVHDGELGEGCLMHFACPRGHGRLFPARVQLHIVLHPQNCHVDGAQVSAGEQTVQRQ